jgi:hypothetical protein
MTDSFLMRLTISPRCLATLRDRTCVSLRGSRLRRTHRGRVGGISVDSCHRVSRQRECDRGGRAHPAQPPAPRGVPCTALHVRLRGAPRHPRVRGRRSAHLQEHQGPLRRQQGPGRDPGHRVISSAAIELSRWDGAQKPTIWFSRVGIAAYPASRSEAPAPGWAASFTHPTVQRPPDSMRCMIEQLTTATSSGAA